MNHKLWIPGSVHLADPVTESKRETRDPLISVLKSGRIPTELLASATVILKTRHSPSFYPTGGMLRSLFVADSVSCTRDTFNLRIQRQ